MCPDAATLSPPMRLLLNSGARMKLLPFGRRAAAQSPGKIFEDISSRGSSHADSMPRVPDCLYCRGFRAIQQPHDDSVPFPSDPQAS